MKNKKIWLSVILSVLALAMVFSLAACSAGDAKESATADKSVTESATATATEAPESATEASSAEETETDKVAREGLWESAIYLSDKSFGSGATVIEVEVIAEGKSVTFTLHTDAETLGEALVAEKLVEGQTLTYESTKHITDVDTGFESIINYRAYNSGRKETNEVQRIYHRMARKPKAAYPGFDIRKRI